MNTIAFPIVAGIVMIGLIVSIFLDRKVNKTDGDINIFS
jgi:hypothetical protein